MAKLKSLNEFRDSGMGLESEKMSKIVGGLLYPRSKKNTYRGTCVNDTPDNSVRSSVDGITDIGSYDQVWVDGSWIECPL